MPKREKFEEDEEEPGTSLSKDTVRKRKKKDKKDGQEIEMSPQPEEEYVPTKQTKIAPKILTTREIGRRYLDRESYLKLCIKEMLVYFVFLIVLGILTAGHHSSNEYYLSRVMTRTFTESEFRCYQTNEIVTYNKINSVEHIWGYFTYFLSNTFWLYWYSDIIRVEPVEPGLNDAILYENKILGRPRVRQVRVKRKSCSVPSEFKGKFSGCYAEYSSSVEDKADFSPSATNYSSVWTYNSASKLGSLPVRGEISTYGGGGYYFDFQHDLTDTNKTVTELLENQWLNKGTRALIMQFTTYNINENLFFTLTLLLEFSPTGGVVTSFIIYIHKFLMRDLWDFLLLGFFLIFALFILWYTIEEIYEITYFRWHYFDSFWNFLDFLILIFAYLTIGSFIYQFLVVQTQIPKLIKKVDKFACFDQINSAKESYLTILAVLFFFAAIKGVKYLNFNHSMHQMQTTLSRATKDVACFSIIFFIVFITFSQLGHLLFGSQVRDFRSFVHSVFALLRTAVGDFDYHKIENVNHFLGPVFFFAYIFFIYFILVNMFLAIIIDTYAEVRTSIRDQGKDLQISTIFGRFFRKICGFCGKKKGAKTQETPQPQESADTSAFNDIENLLRRCGFNDLEIDLFFSKFDIPRDKPISQQEIREKLLQNFNLKNEDLAGILEKERDELGERLMERIQRLEDNITDVNYKIDLIDNKIDSIQQLRAKKRTVQGGQAGAE